MSFLVWIAAVLAAVYVGACGTMTAMQRKLQYFPDPVKTTPAEANFLQARTIGVETSDGERLVAWFVPPREENQPLLLYFHGNAGNLASKAQVFASLTAHGAGLLAVDYRGYGGSTGTPTEAGLHRDADAAYAKAQSLGFGPERIVLVGESLGTGVAVALGAKNPVRALVLEAAYSSVADIAASRYWMLPVRLLMLDRFRSDQVVAAIKVPILFLHGTDDGIIPIRFGQRLFERANQPKTFLTVEHGSHQVLLVPGIMPQVLDWIEHATTTKAH